MQLLSWKGLNIYPLPAEFTAEVTAEDIEQGVKGSCTDCAISKAVCRALGLPLIGLLATSMNDIMLFSQLSAGSGHLAPLFGLRGAAVACWLPDDSKEQTKFIFNFDAGKEVQPTSFTYSLLDGINYKEQS